MEKVLQLRELIKKNLEAYTGLALFQNDLEVLGLGALVSILTSLPNYVYNIYLDIGERIAEVFAKPEFDKNGNLTKVVLTVTPTKGAMLAAIVGTPIMLIFGEEMLKNENFLAKVAGGVLVSTAVLSFVMAITGMIVPDVLAGLGDVYEHLKSKEFNGKKCGDGCEIVENIWLAEKPLVL